MVLRKAPQLEQQLEALEALFVAERRVPALPGLAPQRSRRGLPKEPLPRQARPRVVVSVAAVALVTVAVVSLMRVRPNRHATPDSGFGPRGVSKVGHQLYGPCTTRVR